MKRTLFCFCILAACILLFDGAFNSLAARRGGSYGGGYKGYGGGYRSYGGGYRSHVDRGYYRGHSGYYSDRDAKYSNYNYDRSYRGKYYGEPSDYEGYTYDGSVIYVYKYNNNALKKYLKYYPEVIPKKLNKGDRVAYYFGSNAVLIGYIVYTLTNLSNNKNLDGLANCQPTTSYSFSEQECLKKEDLQKMCALCLKEDDRGCCTEYLDISTNVKIAIKR